VRDGGVGGLGPHGAEAVRGVPDDPRAPTLGGRAANGQMRLACRMLDPEWDMSAAEG